MSPRLNLWKPEPKRRAGIVRLPPVVPGVAIHKYTNRELGVRIARKANVPRQDPGIAWARLMAGANRPEKDAAREAVLSLFGVERFPLLSILTFPASEWRFENALLALRGEREHRGPARTRIVSLERDEAIYRAACHNIPKASDTRNADRVRVSHVRTPPVPPFATACVQTAKISNFFRCEFEEYAGCGGRLDAAWLDFNGQLTPRRLDAIERFWNNGLRTLIVVTLLELHQSDWMRERLKANGGTGGLLAARLPGSAIENVTRYSDGAPMVQIVLRRARRSGRKDGGA